MCAVLASQPLTGKPRRKLLDQVRDVMRLKHYSLRTERAYCDWITRFIRFHQMRHPAEMREPEMSEFLTHLARSENVSAATQNQALSALLFLYKEVLTEEIGWLQNVERAKKPARLPVVLTRDEIHKIFAELRGTARLMAGLLYGSGLRLILRHKMPRCPNQSIGALTMSRPADQSLTGHPMSFDRLKRTQSRKRLLGHKLKCQRRLHGGSRKIGLAAPSL